ncbi:MAG: single-stranded DNA-binding protein [Bacteriovoracaceae bacterium]
MNYQPTITIYGRLGKNPELRQTKKSEPFCTFTLAEQIEGQEEPRWHNIVMWEQDSEHWSKVLKKGAHVFVRGRIFEKQFKNRDGEVKSFNEISAEAIGFVSSL